MSGTTGAVAYIAEDLRILAVPVADLKPAARNARVHAEQDLQVLMHSYSRHGQRKPIIARPGTNEVIAGNGQLEAARRLGWTYIAVSWFHGTDEEAQEFALVDNQSATLSEWDLTELSAQLAEIAARDPQLPQALGWDEAALAPLLAQEWTAPERTELPDASAEATSIIVLTAAERDIVMRAVERVRQRDGDERLTDGRCLEFIAAEFLAGP